MITDEDVKKLEKVFATKNDLKNFATKDDLKKFATGDQLQAVNDRLAEAIVANQTELREFKQEVRDSIEQNTNRILEVMDSFAGEIKTHRENEVFHNHKHDQITDRLDKIEEVSVVAHELRKHAD